MVEAPPKLSPSKAVSSGQAERPASCVGLAGLRLTSPHGFSLEGISLDQALRALAVLR
jgi:hypothetical protein